MSAKKTLLWIMALLSTLGFSEQNEPGFGFSEPNYLLCVFSSSDRYVPLSYNGKSRLKLRIGFIIGYFPQG